VTLLPSVSATARIRALAGCLQALLVISPLTAVAHHSHAEFADESQVIDGELVTIAWRNPHPAMTIRSGSGAGETLWTVQVLGNINGLRRNGITEDIFRIGEAVRIAGQVSRRRAGLLLGTRVEFSDGSVAIIGPDESTGQAIYRGRLAVAPGASPAAVSGDAKPDGIFRVWLVADRFRNPDLPLTPEARARKAAWDSVTEDPQIGCKPLGMPGAMMSPHPIQFIRQGDDIVLRLEEFDASRTIHMQPDATRDEPKTRMGFSTGRWDGDSLEVHTSDIDYPWMDEHGTPQSPAVEVTERFTLSADARSLDYEALVTDPGTFTAPVVAFTTRWEWVPGEALQDYDCAVLDLPPDGAASR
jgi:hypothetical protein